MSNTEYARTEMLRMTPDERHALARAVMLGIQTISSAVVKEDPMRGAAYFTELRALRSLLDRLSD